MTVLVQEIHENLTTHHVFLEKFKDFALARGWTIRDWLTSVAWQWTGSQYEFVAGSESYLAIESIGHGAQILHYRLRGEQSGSDPNNEFVWLGSQDAAHKDIDNALASHPVQQNSWQPYFYHGMKPTDIPKAWLFGNDKFIIAVAQLDNVWVHIFAIGSVELYDTADDEGMFCGHAQTSSYKWYTYNEQDAISYPGDNVYYDGARKTATVMKQNGATFGQGFIFYKQDTISNEFSEARPMFKPLVIVKHNSDGLWRPLGTLPLYRIWAEGLAMGEIVKYGTKQFVCFPNCKLNDNLRYYGLAIQIAE